MHYHQKIATMAAPIPTLPDPVNSCHCREISDCSNGRRAIPAPSHADESTVVCGRGKGAYNRPGNKRFRSLIRSHLPTYVTAANKYQKGLVIQRITHDMEARGLVFVRKSEDVRDDWCELDAKERRDKIGHAIREAVAEQKQRRSKKQASRHDKAEHPMASDSSVSTTHSLDESLELDHDLEDRRSRFDRMLASFRVGQPATKDIQDDHYLHNIAFFQV